MRRVCTRAALNAEVWDVDGKRYIDFAGGIACSTPATATRRDGGVKAQLDLSPHLLPGAGLRALHRAGRAPERLAPGDFAEETCS
jgi:hypothetical protein